RPRCATLPAKIIANIAYFKIYEHTVELFCSLRFISHSNQLSANRLTALPPEIGQLSKLTDLDVRCSLSSWGQGGERDELRSSLVSSPSFLYSPHFLLQSARVQ